MKHKSFFAFLLFIGLCSKAQQDVLDSLTQALKKQNGDTSKAKTLILIGNEYAALQNDSALYFFRVALQLAEKIRFTKAEVEARHGVAEYLFRKNDNATALDLYLKNIEKAQRIRDTELMFEATRKASFIFNKIGDYEKEFDYIKKLEAMVGSQLFSNSSRLNDYSWIITNRLAAVYINLNKLDSAKHYAWLTYESGRKRIAPNHTAVGAVRLAELFDKLNLWDSSFYYNRIALQVSEKAGRQDLLAHTHYRLGKYFWEKKQFDSAYFYSKNAFDLSEGLQALTLSPRMDAAALMASYFEKKKQPDSAYKYLKAHVQMKDSIFNAEKLARLQNVSLKQSLQAMQMEQLKKEAVAEYQSRVKFYSLTAGLVVLIILAAIFYRSSRQRIAAGEKIQKAYQELKETQVQLVQKEKMASLGELTAGIAHEIQNPLNFVNNFAETNGELIDEAQAELRAGNTEETSVILTNIKANEEKIVYHGKRADSIVKSMLQHSRVSAGDKEATDINALVDENLRLAYHAVRAKDKTFNATLHTKYASSIGSIPVVPQDLGRVLINLFNNAFYAVCVKKQQLNGEYEPVVSVSTKAENARVEIVVKDNGNGIPENVKDKIFQPFYTTKPTGEGTGLGLSLSYDIVTKGHGGELTVETKEGEYAEFLIRLPV